MSVDKKPLKPGQVDPGYIVNLHGGLYPSARLEDGAAYRASHRHGGHSLLTKIEGSDKRMSKITVDDDDFHLLMTRKRKRNETLQQCVKRLINEAPDMQ